MFCSMQSSNRLQYGASIKYRSDGSCLITGWNVYREHTAAVAISQIIMRFIWLFCSRPKFKMDVRNKKFWEEFIEVYRVNTCLWDVKSKDYSNKIKRNASYDILLKKYKELVPEGTLDNMKKKINNIRTSFRRELKKVQDSKRTGAGADEVYEPTLWYFDLMFFTAESETGRQGQSNYEREYETDAEPERSKSTLFDEDALDGVTAPATPASTEDISTDNQEGLSENSVVTHYTTPSTKPKVIARKRANTKAKENAMELKRAALVDLAHKAFTEPELDEFDIVGKRFAFQLKKLEDGQRVIAEKLMSDIIFYGAMGRLEEHCTINFPSNVPGHQKNGAPNTFAPNSISISQYQGHYGSNNGPQLERPVYHELTPIQQLSQDSDFNGPQLQRTLQQELTPLQQMSQHRDFRMQLSEFIKLPSGCATTNDENQ